MNELNRDSVLAALGPKPRHLMEICDGLGLARARKGELVDILDALLDIGLVKELPGRRFRIAEKKLMTGPRQTTRSRGPANEIVGRLSAHARGFAFVAPEDGSDDIFIAPDARGGAMQGDRVRVAPRSSAKGRDGHVIEIISRGTRRISGTIGRQGRDAWFIPDDMRLGERLPIDGPVPKDASSTDVFIAEIVFYPRNQREVATVAVGESLGKAGLAMVEVEKLKIRDAVVEPFPEAVLEEARQIKPFLTEEDLKGREDLRHLELLTIDPPDARDHDDAIWAERRPGGGYRVIVAIADVSHYVRPGTAIDNEALERCCTIYLPDRSIPMLPKEISSGMASLVDGEDRLTLAVEVMLAPDGSITDFRYIEGVMRCAAGLTYGGVAAALGWTHDAEPEPEAVARKPILELLAEISDKLRKKRRARGSLEFDLPEARVLVEDVTGEPLDVYRSRSDAGIKKAYAVVEDFMLLANESVAENLHTRNVPALYRIHDKPDAKKLGIFIDLAESFGYSIDIERANNPKELAAFLQSLEGTPHAGPLGTLLLRSMQQARYDVENIGHFALAADDYLHFTSPIRRYPDLAVHRVVRAIVRGEKIDHDKLAATLSRQGLESSRLERRAMILDRDVIDLYRAILLEDRVGEDFHAKISSITEFGIFASLDSPFADVLIPYERLPGTFEANPLGTEAVDRRSGLVYKLGDPAEIRIENVSVTRRQILGVFVEFADNDPRASDPFLNELRRAGLDDPRTSDRRPGNSRPGDRRPTRRRPESGEGDVVRGVAARRPGQDGPGGRRRRKRDGAKDARGESPRSGAGRGGPVKSSHSAAGARSGEAAGKPGAKKTHKHKASKHQGKKRSKKRR
jgi:ribonuclease R